MLVMHESAPQATGASVPTAEQVRQRALIRAQSRGRWVAARRLVGRQIWHSLWTFVFPVVGMFFCVLWLALFGFSKWQGEPVLASIKNLEMKMSASLGTPTVKDVSHLNTLQLDRQLSVRSINAPQAGADPVQ